MPDGQGPGITGLVPVDEGYAAEGVPVNHWYLDAGDDVLDEIIVVALHYHDVHQFRDAVQYRAYVPHLLSQVPGELVLHIAQEDHSLRLIPLDQTGQGLLDGLCLYPRNMYPFGLQRRFVAQVEICHNHRSLVRQVQAQVGCYACAVE